MIGPEVLAGRGVDQLGGDAHAAAALADAPLQDVAHPKFAPDLAYVNNLAFVRERRGSGDHRDVRESG